VVTFSIDEVAKEFLDIYNVQTK